MGVVFFAIFEHGSKLEDNSINILGREKQEDWSSTPRQASPVILERHGYVMVLVMALVMALYSLLDAQDLNCTVQCFQGCRTLLANSQLANQILPVSISLQEVEPDNVLALACYPGLKEVRSQNSGQRHRGRWFSVCSSHGVWAVWSGSLHARPVLPSRSPFLPLPCFSMARASCGTS